MEAAESMPDFRALFEDAPGLFLVLKPDLTILAVTNAYMRATMTDRGVIVGKALFEVFPDNPDDPTATGAGSLKKSIDRAIASKKSDTMSVLKYDIRRPDAEGGGFEERYWSPMNTPVLDSQGNVRYIIHRVEDVTEFVRLKQRGLEQSKLTEELAAQVQKTEMEVYLRARELEEANAKLRELDRLKTEFFANVSHELRTPLTLILAPIESLLADLDDAAANSPSKNLLKVVHHNALRLLHMITGLLDFSKVSAGKTQVTREPLPIEEVTRALFGEFAAVLQSKKISGKITVLVESPVVELDRYLYERMVFNLLSNAVKFTPEGGHIAVHLSTIGDSLRLTVSDSGIGIASDDCKRLFEKFYQVESSSTRRFEGTGLGLAMVKEFAHLLGGSIAVTSEVGQGSCFTLTCHAPRSRAPQAIKSPAVSSFTARMVPTMVPTTSDFQDWSILPVVSPTSALLDRSELPTIVVAEDNVELGAFIESLLVPLCRVYRANDGVEALDLIRRVQPDLVLSDVMMPKLDGIRLTQEIKSSKESSSIPVVLLTAMTDRESLLTGWQAGADDYLFKPFHPRELQARVKSLLTGIEWRRKGEAYRRQRDSLEQFTHIASHDLREPLRKIVCFIQLFQSTKPVLDQAGERYLQFVADAAGRMYRLLDTLIDYVRLDHDNAGQKLCNLNALVAQVLRDLDPDLREANAKVSVGDLPVLMAWESQLAVVFANLVRNSLKYRQENDAPHIRIEAVRRDFEWVLAVKDNGIGFDPKHSERIFIMFERLHGREKYAGDGMGLAICRKIIERHGGKMWAEAVPGVGAAFYLTLIADKSQGSVDTARALSS